MCRLKSGVGFISFGKSSDKRLAFTGLAIANPIRISAILRLQLVHHLQATLSQSLFLLFCSSFELCLASSPALRRLHSLTIHDKPPLASVFLFVSTSITHDLRSIIRCFDILAKSSRIITIHSLSFFPFFCYHLTSHNIPCPHRPTHRERKKNKRRDDDTQPTHSFEL